MRMMTCVVVTAAAAFIAVGAPAGAEEPWQRVQFASGMRELSLWGALDVHLGDLIVLWIGGDLGFMLSPRHEVGPTMDLQVWVFDWDYVDGGSCGGFYRYNIPVRSRRVAPFVGVRAMGFLGDQRDWDAEARAEGGIRHFLSTSSAITLTGFYGRRFGPHCEWWYCPDDNDRFGMTVGVSAFF
jgi:hypothetical protein